MRVTFVRAAMLAAAPVALVSCGGSGYGGGMTIYPPTAEFSQPTQAVSVRLGQTVSLTWGTTYASSCTAGTSGTGAGTFDGAVATSGTQAVAPTATGDYTYTLACSGSGGMVTAHSMAVSVTASILSTLKTITVIGPTPDPVEMGGNPYGLTLAPATSGLITKGDLIVCNFNDGLTNTQGHGTTITGLHPVPGSQPYSIANSPSLEGCNALALLPDDSISAAAYSANLNPLVSSAGTLANPFGSHTFALPWGEVFVAAAGAQPAALYVSNAGDGSIVRITLSGDAPTGFTEVVKGFCASGTPGAIYAPAGLTYDASIDTLYVVDTSSYSVVALKGISAFGTDAVVVAGQRGGATPTPALSFSGPSAASARVIATGGQFNAPLSAALLSDGDLLVANADIDNPAVPNLVFEISPAIGFVGDPLQLDTSGTPGALFGLVATLDSAGHDLVYFNDNNTNEVEMLSQ
ncbi:MAG: hypothetical protein JSS29_03375 [Proteobacteria bacterium]|nr:hypothetical protein [Pseudomonadota bacterium]